MVDETTLVKEKVYNDIVNFFKCTIRTYGINDCHRCDRRNILAQKLLFEKCFGSVFHLFCL